MPSTIGAQTAVSTMLALVWSDASEVMSPGGRCGPSTQMTSGTATTLATSQIASSGRPWRAIASRLRTRPSSYDVQQPVHVAEALHRPAEAEDESGGAGHEALPAVGALSCRCGT